MSATEPVNVTLRTGAEVPEPVVRTTWLALEALDDTNPIALYEAVMVARDRAHVPFGNTGEVLKRIGLLGRDGTMHDATRDVILAAAEGEGAGLHLVSPFASDSSPEVQP